MRTSLGTHEGAFETLGVSWVLGSELSGPLWETLWGSRGAISYPSGLARPMGTFELPPRASQAPRATPTAWSRLPEPSSSLSKYAFPKPCAAKLRQLSCDPQVSLGPSLGALWVPTKGPLGPLGPPWSSAWSALDHFGRLSGSPKGPPAALNSLTNARARHPGPIFYALERFGPLLRASQASWVGHSKGLGQAFRTI